MCAHTHTMYTCTGYHTHMHAHTHTSTHTHTITDTHTHYHTHVLEGEGHASGVCWQWHCKLYSSRWVYLVLLPEVSGWLLNYGSQQVTSQMSVGDERMAFSPPGTEGQKHCSLLCCIWIETSHTCTSLCSMHSLHIKFANSLPSKKNKSLHRY